MKFAFLQITALGALLLLLVGCGGAQQPSGTAPAARPPAPPPAAAPAAPPAPPAKPAWQVEWEKVLAGAQKEGKVVVWGPPGEPVRKAMTEGFAKAYPGLQVEWLGGRGGEQGAKMKAERGAGIYSVDVVIQGLPSYQDVFRPMNVMDPLAPVLLLPEVTDPKSWRNGRLEMSADGMDLEFAISTSPEVIYDPKQVKPEEIDELKKLLDPKLKGKIVINDPVPTGASYSILRNLERSPSLGSREKAAEYLRALKAQTGAVDRDQRRIIESVGQGKYAIAFRPSGGTLGQLIQQGIQVGILGRFKDMPPTAGSSFGTLMRVSKAPHPNAQVLFMNWLLTKEGQTAWSKAMGLGSRRVDVPTDHLPAWAVPQPGVEYFEDKNPLRTPEEEKIVQELFGR